MENTDYKYQLSISIVLYHTKPDEIEEIVNILNRSELKIVIFLIDNSSDDSLAFFGKKENVEYIYLNKNVGYGTGHNVAIKRMVGLSKYHLVLNADVEFDPSILTEAFNYMEKNKDVGLLSPMVLYPNGEFQHTVRFSPTPLDLIVRRFIPGFAKPFFKKRFDSFLNLDKDFSRSMNVPNLPGCFMFARMSILEILGGFDENIFMYNEDIDLTRRMNEITKTVYYPQISIIHKWERGSNKNMKLFIYHIRSAIYYFNKWGWLNHKKINAVNKNIQYLD